MKDVLIQHSEHGAYAVGLYENVAVVVTDQSPTLETVAHIAALEAHWPAGSMALLQFANATVRQPPPGEDVRRRYLDLMKRFGNRVVGVAVVVWGGGMTGALIRSVVTGLALLARPGFPVKCFDEVEDAAVWLAPLTGVEMSPEGLAQAVELLRTYPPPR